MVSSDPLAHAAQLAGIGRDGVIPFVRQRVTSWTEITAALSITP